MVVLAIFLEIVVPVHFFNFYELSFQTVDENSEGLWKQVLTLVNQAETASRSLPNQAQQKFDFSIYCHCDVRSVCDVKVMTSLEERYLDFSNC